MQPPPTDPAAAIRVIAHLRRAPRRRLLRLALVAATLRARAAHRELAFASLRDYVAERGLRWSTFQDHAAAGTLFLSSMPARTLYRRGELSIPTAALLVRRVPAESWPEALERCRGLPLRRARAIVDGWCPAAPAEPRTPDAEVIRAKFRVPLPVADYLGQTLELARALQGSDGADQVGLAAVVAEASTEVPLLVDEPEAFARFPVRTPARRSRAPSQPPARVPGLTLHGSPLRSAHRLDGIFRRLLRGLRRDRWLLEEAVWQAERDELHGRAGYLRFLDFCHREIGLPATTAWTLLDAARARRRGCPIAAAEAEALLGPAQSDLLRRLPRLGVPMSCLGAWIRAALLTTTRRLRRMVRWARRHAARDLLAWSRDDYAPPTEDAIRATDQSPTEIAANPEPPRPHVLRDAATTTVNWPIEADDLALLVRMMASLQDLARDRLENRDHLLAPRPPAWWALLQLFHLARVAWQHTEPLSGYRFARVVERDRYRCQVPGCTQRRTLEAHHIRYRSRGGDDEATNLITLCHFHHHHGEHGQRLRVHGTAAAHDGEPHRLRWEMALDESGRPTEVFDGEEQRIA